MGRDRKKTKDQLAPPIYALKPKQTQSGLQIMLISNQRTKLSQSGLQIMLISNQRTKLAQISADSPRSDQIFSTLWSVLATNAKNSLKA